MSKGRKRLVILVSLICPALVLMTLQHDGRSFSFLQGLTRPFYFFNNAATSVCSNIRAARDTFEENKRLKSETGRLLLERQRFGELVQENKRLKDLLSLKEHEPRYVAGAKAVTRGYDRLLNTVIIDKGAGSGIEKGMAVITTRGLAGKIHAVKNDFSEVLLLRDPNFSVGVRLQNSRREGVVSGTGRDTCTLKYIPPEENVEQGEAVVTSGLDGIFPPGLPVGTVSGIKKEGVEFFQQIDVVPFQPDSKLEEVVIFGKD